MIRIGFDIGGTFTDFALAQPGKPLSFHKVSSTPDDPARAVLQGLDELVAKTGLRVDAIDAVLHATTVATNAILERKGAKTALITTAGFRDVLLIGRQKRYDVFDLYMKKPEALIKRRDIFEVSERLNARGEVVAPLDMASVDAAIDGIIKGGYTSIAVSLLHAYANPAHERQVIERVRERLSDLITTASSDVSPRYREYERASTAVANAYVKPTVGGYLDQLQGALERRGFRSGLSIMQSNGGLVSPQLARAYPVRIVESGPAAGVLMCAEIGRELGITQILTFDMGGTTAKLGAIDNGQPAVSPTFEVDMVRFLKGSGLPLNISSIELLEIGAGGGSIAATEMGLIKVGPQSAGSVPGPMCYGKGGTHPTVTDANVVLGYIDPNNFNGGAIKLDAEASHRGIGELVAKPLGLSVGRAAWGVHAMVNSSMERALRIVSIERGRDPRAYAMVAFGGAGPIHAARLARQVGIRRVIVPFGAGVGSAVGLLKARPKVDVSLTRILPVSKESQRDILHIRSELRGRIGSELESMGSSVDEVQWMFAAYMRYRGQGHDIRVQLPADPGAADFVETMVRLFHEAYQRNYGYCEKDSAVEASEWHLSAERTLAPSDTPSESPTPRPSSYMSRKRLAYFPEDGDYRHVEVVSRAEIQTTDRIHGPAVIEEREATTVILEGDVARVGQGGHLIIDIATES
jgi:N-methylhydantoinase A